MNVLYVEDNLMDVELTSHSLTSPNLGIRLEVLSTVQEAR